MTTIYLREKKSGNFEITNRENHTHKFTTKKAIYEFFAELDKLRWMRNNPKVIKSTYSRSQTYFWNADEFYNAVKN